MDFESWRIRLRALAFGYYVSLDEAGSLLSRVGSSLTATLMGTLIKDGVYSLDQFAPVPEWQKENDPRRKIRIQDILKTGEHCLLRSLLSTLSKTQKERKEGDSLRSIRYSSSE